MATTTSTVSLVLLKPECLEHDLVSPATEAIEAAGLVVACRHTVEMTVELIERTFSTIPRDRHVLEHIIFDLQYGGRRVEVLRVAGDDAVASALAARNAFRAGHVRTPWANYAHAPDDILECAYQLRALVPECGDCMASVASVPLDDPRPFFSDHPLLELEEEAEQSLREALAALYREDDSPFWVSGSRPVVLDGPTDAELAVVNTHNPLSVDNLVAALAGTFPETTVEATVVSVLGGLHSPVFTVAKGPAPVLAPRVDRLRELGVRAELRGA